MPEVRVENIFEKYLGLIQELELQAPSSNGMHQARFLMSSSSLQYTPLGFITAYRRY